MLGKTPMWGNPLIKSSCYSSKVQHRESTIWKIHLLNQSQICPVKQQPQETLTRKSTLVNREEFILQNSSVKPSQLGLQKSSESAQNSHEKLSQTLSTQSQTLLQSMLVKQLGLDLCAKKCGLPKQKYPQEKCSQIKSTIAQWTLVKPSCNSVNAQTENYNLLRTCGERGYPEIRTQSDEEREVCEDEWANEEEVPSIYMQCWGWINVPFGLLSLH